jgi:Protein of unknown function (DUF1571)
MTQSQHGVRETSGEQQLAGPTKHGGRTMMRLLLLALLPILVVVGVVVFVIIPMPDQAVPGAVPDQVLPSVKDDGRKLPPADRMEDLARSDPIAFVENCLVRYDRTVKGYSTTMQKQERIDGKLQRKELVDVRYRVKPHSVFMEWREGARLAFRVVYVEGENNGKLIVKPAGLGSFLIVERDPEGADARKSGRYTLKEFGIKMGMQRTLSDFKAAKKEGALHVEYLGKQKVKEAGDRLCYVLKRTRYSRPEADGITEATFYFDVENWLLVGTILKGDKGQLIGEYFFRDLRLNPQFAKNQFTREAVKGK